MGNGMVAYLKHGSQLLQGPLCDSSWASLLLLLLHLLYLKEIWRALKVSPMMERYRSKGFLCYGGTRINGWRRYSLMSSKALWHSLFHICGSFFLKSLKMGSQVEVSLAMNRLMYCSRPKKPLISFSLLDGGISNIALILDGSTSIAL